MAYSMYRRGEGSTVDAREVLSQYVDAVESVVDMAIDRSRDVVHELRSKAQEVADAMLDRMNTSWQTQRPRFKAYLDAHPWIVFGGLLLLAYLFSGNQREHQSANYRR